MATLRRAGWLVFAVSSPLLLYASLRLVTAWDKGYPWGDMDWNRDGGTSLFEFVSAGDVGVREVERGDRICREYFSYKDGLPMKTVCPE